MDLYESIELPLVALWRIFYKNPQRDTYMSLRYFLMGVEYGVSYASPEEVELIDDIAMLQSIIKYDYLHP